MHLLDAGVHIFRRDEVVYLNFRTVCKSTLSSSCLVSNFYSQRLGRPLKIYILYVRNGVSLHLLRYFIFGTGKARQHFVFGPQQKLLNGLRMINDISNVMRSVRVCLQTSSVLLHTLWLYLVFYTSSHHGEVSVR